MMDIKGSMEVDGKMKSFQWWKDDCFFKYNGLLVSAFYAMKEGWDFREKLGIGNDVLLVADSGGYQILRQESWIEPIDLIKWQERNCDVALTLDNPLPYVDATNIEKRKLTEEVAFNRALERTYRFIKIMERNRKREDLTVLNVLHGRNLRELEKWYNKVKEVKFEGWCLSLHPPTPKWTALISTFIYAKEQPHQVHMLLGSGFKTTPVLVYASKLFETTTFDSLSYHAHGFRMQYVLPWSVGHDVYDYGWKKGEPVLPLPCPCPVCQSLTIERMTDIKLGGRPVSLHNLWLTIQYTNFLKTLSLNEERYKNFLKNNYPEEVTEAIDFIDAVDDLGFEKAYPKFYKKRLKESLM